jgi:hypothetical protein
MYTGEFSTAMTIYIYIRKELTTGHMLLWSTFFVDSISFYKEIPVNYSVHIMTLISKYFLIKHSLILLTINSI